MNTHCPIYNEVISAKDISDDSGTITEPVSVTEMKNYLRLAAFGGGSGTLTFDDVLIGDMITAGRQLLEEMLNVSLIFHTWEVIVTNLNGRIEIPYGPVIKIWQVLDGVDGVTALTYTTEGNLWLRLVTPTQRNIKLRYDAGYNDLTTERLPMGIKIDLKRLVTYMYFSRGDETKVEDFAAKLCAKYSRNLIA